MKTKLYELSEENIYTLLSYYELIKEKSEKYYSNISKFNKLTSNYCISIKNIFNIDEEYLESDNNINYEINQIDQSKNLGNALYVDIVISNTKTIRKKMDTSPIENNLAKINKLFKNYINCLGLFIKSIENLLLSINQNIEKTKSKINNIKNNYSLEKQNFFQKYSEFEELNKKLNMKYFEEEKNLVQYALKIKSLEEKEKESNEDDINLKIYNSMKFQREIEQHFKKLGKFGKIFNNSYEKSIKEVGEVTNSFYKEFETQINNILILYEKSFLTSINQLMTEKNILKLYGSQFNDIIKNNIKNIDSNLYEFSFDEYNLKILNKNIEEVKEVDENTKTFNNIIKSSNKKLNGNDIFLIVKKMYNFKYINKKDYILEIEKEIINLNEKIDKLFMYANYRKVNNLNLVYGVNTNNDKTNNINKNAENENGGDIFEEHILVNIEPNDSDVDYICKLMSKKEYRNHFLIRLNNFRSFGFLSMPEKIYNYIVKIIIEMTNYLVEEKQSNSGKETIIDYNTIRYLFILSQTFFYSKDKKKIYLQHGLKDVKIFHDVELWKNLLILNIKIELDNMAKKSNKKFSEKEYFEKGCNICLMQILPYISGLNGFGLEMEKIKELAEFFISEYHLKDDEKEAIFHSIKDFEEK